MQWNGNMCNVIIGQKNFQLKKSNTDGIL